MYKILTYFHSFSNVQVSVKRYNLHKMTLQELNDLVYFIQDFIEEKLNLQIVIKSKIEHLKNLQYEEKEIDTKYYFKLLQKAKGLEVELKNINFVLAKINEYIVKISNVELYHHNEVKHFSFMNDEVDKLIEKGWNMSPKLINGVENYSNIFLWQERKLNKSL